MNGDPLARARIALIQKARSQGGDPPVYLSGREMLILTGFTCLELSLPLPAEVLPAWKKSYAKADFLSLRLSAFARMEDDGRSPSKKDLENLWLKLYSQNPDSLHFLHCLTLLHAHRRKYLAVKQSSKKPGVRQLAFHTLLEAGQVKDTTLARRVRQEKHTFILHNRKSSIGGYLLQEIQKAGLDLPSASAAEAKVRRDGTGTGRQVDCLDEKRRIAYEFKVSIADSSKQGRWNEEVRFPHDCARSGYKPVLMVQIDTQSKALAALADEYRKAGGEVYVGNQVWEYVMTICRPAVAAFIRKYIISPMDAVIEAE